MPFYSTLKRGERYLRLGKGRGGLTFRGVVRVTRVFKKGGGRVFISQRKREGSAN